MGLDMIWTGTKRSKAMYIWRRGRKAGLDTETSLWPTTDIGSGAGHVVVLKENWFWNWKKYIKSQEFFQQKFANGIWCNSMTGSTTMLESGLGVEIVGKSGREISEILSLVTGCRCWQRWEERDMQCLVTESGKMGRRVETKFMSRKSGNKWVSINGHLTSILNAGFTCKIEENKLVFSNLTLSYCCICCNCIFLWQLCTNQSDLI